jgi:hypothetical protein
LRLAVLASRVPLDAPQQASYQGLLAALGIVTDDEWAALLAALTAIVEEGR